MQLGTPVNQNNKYFLTTVTQNIPQQIHVIYIHIFNNNTIDMTIDDAIQYFIHSIRQ